MAEEHLRQLINSFAQKGKIEPWEYQEIQAVAQRHNVSPGRVQVLITEVVNSIDYQNLPKETPKPGHIMTPFLDPEKPGTKKDEHILQAFQKPVQPAATGPEWVRSEKKKISTTPEPKPEPEAGKSSNTFKIVLLIILIVISLYILLGWVQPERPATKEAEDITVSEDYFRASELEKFYNGLYFSDHKKSKTLLVLELLDVDEDRGRAEARFQLNGESFREKATIDFENHTITIPKLGPATFYKSGNTVIIESNGSVNKWKIK